MRRCVPLTLVFLGSIFLLLKIYGAESGFLKGSGRPKVSVASTNSERRVLEQSVSTTGSSVTESSSTTTASSAIAPAVTTGLPSSVTESITTTPAQEIDEEATTTASGTTSAGSYPRPLFQSRLRHQFHQKQLPRLPTERNNHKCTDYNNSKCTRLQQPQMYRLQQP